MKTTNKIPTVRSLAADLTQNLVSAIAEYSYSKHRSKFVTVEHAAGVMEDTPAHLQLLNKAVENFVWASSFNAEARHAIAKLNDSNELFNIYLLCSKDKKDRVSYIQVRNVIFPQYQNLCEAIKIVADYMSNRTDLRGMFSR